LACNCATDDLAIQIGAADVVAFGEVEHFEPARGCGGQAEVQLRVVRAFVGAGVGNLVVLESGAPRDSCSISFVIGETWLLVGKGGVASICGSARVDEDDELLDEVQSIVSTGS